MALTHFGAGSPHTPEQGASLSLVLSFRKPCMDCICAPRRNVASLGAVVYTDTPTPTGPSRRIHGTWRPPRHNRLACALGPDRRIVSSFSPTAHCWLSLRRCHG